MAAKLTRLTHKIAIKLHLVAESCTICSSRSRWPVRKLLDMLSTDILLWNLRDVVSVWLIRFLNYRFVFAMNEQQDDE
jgi:hypothetical protein